MTSQQSIGPLVLGATGRLGQVFRRLWADGLWPGAAEPLWQGRRPEARVSIIWDFMEGSLSADPRVRAAKGVIVLAGVTAGTESALAANRLIAERAVGIAADLGLGPVLLCSSAAVYGRAAGAQAEGAVCHPATAYGAAKLAMEQAVAGRGAICLRIANVAGSDQLFMAAARGRMTLDRFPSGTGPERAYIGPLSLAATFLALIDLAAGGTALPAVLNLAAPRPVGMQTLLSAAGVPWDWVPAPATAIESVTLDTAVLQSLAPLPDSAADADALVAEARAGGWRPAA
jgi:nucleoside-diphosphate-sugar epimerase